MKWAMPWVFLFVAACCLTARASAQPDDDKPVKPSESVESDSDRPVPPDDGDDERRGPRHRFDHKGPPPGGPMHDGFRGPGGPRGPGGHDGQDHPPGPPFGFGPGGPGGHHGPHHGPHGDFESLEKNDPEMFKLLEKEQQLDHQSRDLAQQYRRAPTDQQPAIKEKLAAAVTAHFEARQSRRLVELKRLEDELKRLRESIDRRNKAQHTIVNDRVSNLLGLDDGF